jgi:hypothetical protein
MSLCGRRSTYGSQKQIHDIYSYKCFITINQPLNSLSSYVNLFLRHAKFLLHAVCIFHTSSELVEWGSDPAHVQDADVPKYIEVCAY